MAKSIRRVVRKYEVKCCNYWKQIALPRGVKILSAVCKQPANAGDGILVYAEIDPEQTTFDLFEFFAVGTGCIFELKENMTFLNTVQIPAPINEVYHVYYV